MKSIFIITVIAAVLAFAGCRAFTPEPARATLDQADAKIVAADYSGAQALYAEFVNANPDSPQAARARAMQTVLDRLLSSQAELDRARRSDEIPRLRRELSERQNEAERLKSEISKLRSDIERLRSIDLQTLPGPKK